MICTNYMSSERALRAESNDTNIAVIRLDLTKIWLKSSTPVGLNNVITLSNLVRLRWFWCHSTQLDELFRMSYHLHKLFYFKKSPLWLYNFQRSVFRSNRVGFCWFWCHSTQLDGFYNCCSDWPFLHIFWKNWRGGELNKYPWRFNFAKLYLFR